MVWQSRGEIRGPVGTFDDASGLTLPPGSDVTVAIGGTPARRTVVIGVPEGKQGIPGVNAVANDTATASYIANPTTETAGALKTAIGGAILSSSLTPVLIDTRDTGLAPRSPANLRTGLPSTTFPGGGYTDELSIAVAGVAGSAILASTEPAKVAGLGANPFAAVLNATGGGDDFFVTVLSQNGTEITLREPLQADFAGTLSAKYDQAVGQHLTQAATRAYAQHALAASGTTDGRGAILAGTWDALPPTHNKAWVRNAALIAYGISNSPAPIVRTELTIQGVHNMIHPTDLLDMFPSGQADGVIVGTHLQGHGASATLYTGRVPAVLEFCTAAIRSALSSFGYLVRVVVTGDGVVLFDQVLDAFMHHIVIPVVGIDKLEIAVTNDNPVPTPFNLMLSHLTLREAGDSGRVGGGKIVMLGDSWFAFYGAAMGKFVQEKAPGASVVTHALGGMTTMWGLDWFDEYVLKENPAECWIHFFTNDLNNLQTGTYVAPDGTSKPVWPTGLTSDQSQALWVRNLRELINRCLRAGIRPVVFLPGGTASEAQILRHGNGAAAFDRPPLRDWVALAGELTDATSYVNTIGKRPGSRVLVGTTQKVATGGAPADAWV